MVVKNYYKILDLETSRVSIDEVKQAYRQAAKKYHPDLNVGNTLAEERIKDINEAYKILSNSSSKKKYDRIWNSNFEKGAKAFSLKNEKNVFFNMFFGNIEKEKKDLKKEKNKHAVKGENIETEIKISIYEAFYGLKKQISLKNVNGNQKMFSLEIPKGIRNGEKIRLIGLGKAGQNGGKNGDLFLKVKIEDDKRFRLKGYDIYTDVLVTPWEAALGTKLSIKTIEDETNIYIPKGIQSGETIKIPNKGYIGAEKHTRGDLIAEIKIVVPKRLTEQEKEEYKKLSQISKFNPRR